jgi:hypothetical protein
MKYGFCRFDGMKILHLSILAQFIFAVLLIVFRDNDFFIAGMIFFAASLILIHKGESK